MKRLLFIAGIALAGCTEAQEGYLVHREGSDAADRTRALDQCEFAAIQAVPRALGVDYNPGFSTPGTVQCSTAAGYTSCNTVGAINVPATASTFDANAELRQRYTNRCIEDQGYAVLRKPICRTGAERAAFAATLNNQPPANVIPCMVPRGGN